MYTNEEVEFLFKKVNYLTKKLDDLLEERIKGFTSIEVDEKIDILLQEKDKEIERSEMEYEHEIKKLRSRLKYLNGYITELLEYIEGKRRISVNAIYRIFVGYYAD